MVLLKYMTILGCLKWIKVYRYVPMASDREGIAFWSWVDGITGVLFAAVVAKNDLCTFNARRVVDPG